MALSATRSPKRLIFPKYCAKPLPLMHGRRRWRLKFFDNNKRYKRLKRYSDSFGVYHSKSA